MPSVWHGALAGIVAAMFWSALGFPLARWLLPALPAWGVAPVLGWAVFTAIAAPLQGGWSVVLIGLVAAGWGVRRLRAPIWLVALAGGVAVLPAIAVFPKIAAGGAVALAGPIFDHAKIALIDAIARQGLPPVNPFFGGAAPPLAYYYWWHASAAELMRVLPVSGWEADVGLTWFTAFASLLLMAGLAVAMSGRVAAGVVAIGLSLIGSLRPMLGRPAWLLPATGLGGWLMQVSWAPQHVMAGCCVVVAALLLARLAEGWSVGAAVVLGCVVAAGFGSSTWVGGFAFAAGAVLVGGWAMWRGRDPRAFLLGCGIAAGVALVLVAPLLREQMAAAAGRGGGAPVMVAAYPVLAVGVPGRALLDLPGFGMLLLIEFPVLAVFGWRGWRDRAELPGWSSALGLAALGGVLVTWWLRSTIANNDLGWRAILPALLVATAVAARAIVAARGWWAVAAVALGLAGAPAGLAILRDNLVGLKRPSGLAFAGEPALWAAVRAVSGPGERVAGNPLAFGDMTAWPANIGWALLADRPACYSGWATAQPFAAVSNTVLYATDSAFARVFAGAPVAGDLDVLARSGCSIVVVRRGDGAWGRDPFAASGRFALVRAEADQWRIYRAMKF